MGEPARRKATEAEYLALEETSEARHHFIDGEIIAMAGGSERHNVIAARIVRALGNALIGSPCIAVGSDQRHRVEATGAYTYPDVTVRCVDEAGPNRSRVVFEVISASTEGDDRGRKFFHLQQDPDVQSYVLVEQRDRRVQHFFRDASGWRVELLEGDEGHLHLPSLELDLSLADVYLDAARWPSDDPDDPMRLG